MEDQMRESVHFESTVQSAPGSIGKTLLRFYVGICIMVLLIVAAEAQFGMFAGKTAADTVAAMIASEL
jgi:hypothetical protein